MDHLERLKECARTELLPDEERLLVGTLSEGERARLTDLMRTWPPERDWPPPRAEVRRCLDRTGGRSGEQDRDGTRIERRDLIEELLRREASQLGWRCVCTAGHGQVLLP